MEKPISVQQLISSVELNNYGLVWSLMQRRKNHHFFAHRVKKAKNAYFEFATNSAEWSNDFSIRPVVNDDGFKFEEVFIDLKLKGTINEYNTSGRTFFSEPVDLVFTIRAFVQEDGWVNADNIHFMNQEQKALLTFHRKYEEELDRIGVKTLDGTKFLEQDAFSFFTRIWKNVDNTDNTMVTDTSLNYYHEFVEANRNIMYSVSVSNMWGRYASHHTDNSYPFQGSVVYPLEPSFYDTKYIFHLEVALEEIYTFYERIAYLTSLFMKPDYLAPMTLSFNKLFDKQSAKQLKEKFPMLKDNSYFKWFTDRVKNQHRTLSSYRHPLIHYKTNNNFLKGSISVSRTRTWLDNAMNEEELSKLHLQIEEIHCFVNRELLETYTAFEQVVLLCESLPSTAKEKLKDEILQQEPLDASSISDPVELQIKQMENKDLPSLNE